MASSMSIPMATEGNLSRYLQDIRKFPMLAPEEELSLATPLEGTGRRAMRRTSSSPSHLRLVAKIAMGYRGYGLPVGELISEGNVGMMQAVKRFDPDRGFRLATYAMWWIRAAIQEYILHSWSLVKMGTTAAQKKLFFNLRRLKGQMQALEEGDLQPEQVAKIAHALQVPEQDVVVDEPPPRRPRPQPQRAGPRRQRGRVAGLAGRRRREPGERTRRAAGHVQPPRPAATARSRR